MQLLRHTSVTCNAGGGGSDGITLASHLSHLYHTCTCITLTSHLSHLLTLTSHLPHLQGRGRGGRSATHHMPGGGGGPEGHRTKVGHSTEHTKASPTVGQTTLLPCLTHLPTSLAPPHPTPPKTIQSQTTSRLTPCTCKEAPSLATGGRSHASPLDHNGLHAWGTGGGRVCSEVSSLRWVGEEG